MSSMANHVSPIGWIAKNSPASQIGFCYNWFHEGGLDVPVSITQSAITCSAGTPTFSIFNPVSLNGLYSTTGIGTIDISISPSVEIVGIVVTGYIGILQVASTSVQDTNIFGVTANILLNNPTYKVESNISLTSLVSTTGIGSIDIKISQLLYGLESLGIASEIIVNSSTVSVIGAISQTAIGQLLGDLSETINLSGLHATALSGVVISVLSPSQYINGVGGILYSGNISNIVSAVIVVPTKKIIGYIGNINLSEGKYRYSRPELDIDDGVWKARYGDNLYNMLDEGIAQDADYIYSQSIGQPCKMKMTDVADPNNKDEHIIRYKGVGTFEVTLWCEDTEIATWQESILELTMIEHALTTEQASLIHDYKLLRVSIKS